jgi:molybdenum cofactor guanylyltransferase
MTEHLPIPGVILAGGLARRMGGGDKPMRAIGGRTLLDRVIDRLAPQCEGLIVNANGDPARFASFKLPIVPDAVEDYAGPLAGILAGFDWMTANRPEARWMLSAAGDCPFLPRDLTTRLHHAVIAQNTPLGIASSDGQTHPTIGLWNISLRDDLHHALVEENCRAVHRWIARHQIATVDWPASPVDPFFNANTPEDLSEAERLAAIEDAARCSPSLTVK